MTAPIAGARPLHVVVPGDVADATVPSGGNAYDRRVCQGLAGLGWRVREIAVPGDWPRPDAAARAELARSLATLPDSALVLLDGLVACGVPEVVTPQAHRLRLVPLVHLPLADEAGLDPDTAADLHARERATLRAGRAVVVTSAWAARRLAWRHGLSRSRIHVAEPGTDPAPLAPGTDGASRLLCVAAVTPTKGQDLLVRALADLVDLPWNCVCVGALRRDPGYVARLRDLIGGRGLGERIRLAGPQPPERMAAMYASADLLVLASRAETYGMAVAEALARGIPVLATRVGGVPETLGGAPGGATPGILVPPEDTAALATALRRWFGDRELRERIRTSARERRRTLMGWERTVTGLAGVLDQVWREPGGPLEYTR